MKLSNIRKIFLLGDLHLGVKNNSIEWSDIQTSYLLDSFLNQVDQEGFDEKTDILLQVGDWNHVRESTNVRIQEVSQKIAEEFCKKFKRGVYFFVGNHDCYYKDRTDLHSLKGYDKMFPNFHIFEDPSLIEINDKKALILPWTEDLSSAREALALYSNAQYLFCHSDFTGFDLNSAVKIEHGLTFKDVAHLKKVYSGHIHIRQEKRNIVYVGTPYEMDRGDRGNQKGFYVINVEDFSHKFVPNLSSPRHLRFEITEILNLNLQEIRELFNNNFIDINVDTDSLDTFPLTRFTELVKPTGYRKIEFFSQPLAKEQNAIDVEMNSNYEFNLFKILEEYLNSLSYTKPKKEKVLESFVEKYKLLKNAKSYN